MTAPSWCVRLGPGPHDESKTEAAHRPYVAEALGVVPEFPSQAAEMTREVVVSDLGSHPQRIRELFVGNDSAGPGGKGVENDVFIR